MNKKMKRFGFLKTKATNRSTKIAVLCLFIVMAPLFAFLQADKKPVFNDAFRLIDVWLEAQHEYDRLPGIAVGIVTDQQLVWSRAYGMADVEHGAETRINTIYSICSISKLFTSVAIMQLRDAGKFDLDDCVEELLPWFNIEQQFPGDGPVTVRSLLTHSSGLPRESAYPYWGDPENSFPSVDELRGKLGSQKTLYPPSTYFQYSNLGMSLLGEIVAEVSGMPYDEYVEENILKPLRLSDTRTYLPAEFCHEQLATGYSALGRDGIREKMPLFQARGIAPAAGFSSTVVDLARFASWQFRLLEKGGEEILKAPSLREMHRVQWMDPDGETKWGLGFSIYQNGGKNLVGHGGSCPGYNTILLLDTKLKQAFVVMVNAKGVSPWTYAAGMIGILKKSAEEEHEKKSSVVNLDEYMGLYDLQPWLSEIAMVPWNDKLAVINLPAYNVSEELTLYQHIKGDTFRRIRKDKTLGEELSFERDETGKIIKSWQHNNYRYKKQ